MILFAGVPGRVLVMEDPAAQGLLPPLVTVAGGAISFTARKCLITRVALSAETNHQFAHMLGGDIYIYVFGDRIASMVVSGMAVAYNCDQPGDYEHGVEKVMHWYAYNKLSSRQNPVTLMIGMTPLIGYLGGFQADVMDHRLNLMQFNLNFFLPPPR